MAYNSAVNMLAPLCKRNAHSIERDGMKKAPAATFFSSQREPSVKATMLLGGSESINVLVRVRAAAGFEMASFLVLGNQMALVSGGATVVARVAKCETAANPGAE